MNGQVLDFGVSGKLIMNALVMFDRETGTLWSHFLSQAISGPLKGTKLENVPVTLTPWGKWVETYPDTLALNKGFSGSSDPYTGYYRDRSAGVIGEMHVDDRLPTKELVLGAGFDSQPKAFPHTVLVESGLVNDFVADQPVLVYFDPITATALAFDRTLDGQELTFELLETDDGVYLIDDQTGTKWVPFTGQALDGELAGNALRRVHAVNVFWFAWTDFFPDSEVFGIP